MQYVTAVSFRIKFEENLYPNIKSYTLNLWDLKFYKVNARNGSRIGDTLTSLVISIPLLIHQDFLSTFIFTGVARHSNDTYNVMEKFLHFCFPVRYGYFVLETVLNGHCWLRYLYVIQSRTLVKYYECWDFLFWNLYFYIPVATVHKTNEKSQRPYRGKITWKSTHVVACIFCVLIRKLKA